MLFPPQDGCHPGPSASRHAARPLSSDHRQPTTANRPLSTAFTYRLARPEDDPALRALMRATPMPGSATVAYEREPNFFLGNGPLGDTVEPFVALTPDGQLASVGSRAVRRVFVGGQEQRVGYLSGWRVDPAFRGRMISVRGFQFCHSLHEADPVPFYLATVTAGNDDAKRIILAQSRGPIPAFQPVAEVTTLSLIVRRGRRDTASPYLIQTGGAETWPEIIAFLGREGRRYDFFPALHEDDLGTPLLRGLAPEDFLLARTEAGALVGAVALWDQSGFKQSVVQGYTGALRWTYPLVSLGARLAGASSLPRPGQPLRAAYAAFLATAQQGVLPVLLRTLLRRAAQDGHAFVLLGLTDTDPRLVEAKRLPHIAYASTLYTAAWPDGAAPSPHRPYVEIAQL